MRYVLMTSVICLILTGCEEPSPHVVPPVVKVDESPTAPTAPTAPAPYTGPIVTFLDSTNLQIGTGAQDENVPQEFASTQSGLKYRILRASEGQKPTVDSHVTVHYRGWLSDGTEFDSSYLDAPRSFPLGGVIAGWTEGLQLVGLGGMIELWIPSKMGYGAGGYGSTIPPDSTLHFVVELLEVE